MTCCKAYIRFLRIKLHGYRTYCKGCRIDDRGCRLLCRIDGVFSDFLQCLYGFL